ncbi:unnamed protein product [Hymenolepis diminuta]|uniref:Uncharacterized protein n=1 Tax=Hymenolepis diminuta TaxID=6216 RepID=A0A564Z5Z6_HYMDI|nr:unnamed protein product [Hymenolepis diminuta]
MLALVLLCVFMFLGCYVAGYIPIAFNYSPHNLRLVTFVGAGLLVGAALAIIIPEGVVTIYGVQRSHNDHAHTKPIGSHHSINNNVLDAPHLNQMNDPVAAPLLVGGIAQPAAVQPRPAANQPEPLAPADAQKPVHSPISHHELSAAGVTNHGMIGLALTMGFVLMFLIDHLSKKARCRTCSRSLFPLFQCMCCRRRSEDMLLPTTGDEAMSGSAATNAAAALAEAEHSAMTTTVGLVVHSLADGLAIGAAFGLTLDLTLILFIAIMLHKVYRVILSIFYASQFKISIELPCLAFLVFGILFWIFVLGFFDVMLIS